MPQSDLLVGTVSLVLRGPAMHATRLSTCVPGESCRGLRSCFRDLLHLRQLDVAHDHPTLMLFLHAAARAHCNMIGREGGDAAVDL